MRTDETHAQDRPELAGQAALPLFIEALGKSGSAKMRALGSSMRPAICGGDMLTIRKCGPDELSFGDIAACGRDGGIVIHRLIARTRAGLILKGDTLWRPDAPIPPGNLLGRVETIESPGATFHLNTPAARASNAATLIYMLPVSFLLAAWALYSQNRKPAPAGGALKRIRAALESPPRFAASKLSNTTR